jgi:mannose-6-phosphate isomerase-like protein (cupin superfamily)
MVRVLKPGDAEKLSLPGRSSQAVVAGNRGAENVSFRIVEIAPLAAGEKERGPHVHHSFEECIYVLAGTGVMRTEKGEHPVAAGDTILVPPGELHVTHATGSETLKLLCFFPTANVGAGTKEFSSWDEARGK